MAESPPEDVDYKSNPRQESRRRAERLGGFLLSEGFRRPLHIEGWQRYNHGMATLDDAIALAMAGHRVFVRCGVAVYVDATERHALDALHGIRLDSTFPSDGCEVDHDEAACSMCVRGEHSLIFGGA